jgi:hypothetical protein
MHHSGEDPTLAGTTVTDEAANYTPSRAGPGREK